MFEEAFYGFFEKVAAKAIGNKKFPFKHDLTGLDSTVIDLCLSLRDRAMCTAPRCRKLCRFVKPFTLIG